MQVAFVVYFLLNIWWCISARVFLEENFDEKWASRWIDSVVEKDFGFFEYTEGDRGHPSLKGIRTMSDASFYAISRKFDSVLSTSAQRVIVQFTVRFENDVDCGGAFFKFLPSSLVPRMFEGKSNYYFSFGPDVCAKSSNVNLMFRYKDYYSKLNQNIPVPTDDLTHLYTLLLDQPSNKFTIYIDMEQKFSGKLTEEIDFFPAKKIRDPNAKKPDDWDDQEFIPDPKDKRHPDDVSRSWEQDFIPNPKFQGRWEAPLIDNPKYFVDYSVASYNDVEYAGLALWQVRAGTIFGNLLVTDDWEYAVKAAETRWKPFLEEERAILNGKVRKPEDEMSFMDKKIAELMGKKSQEHPEQTVKSNPEKTDNTRAQEKSSEESKKKAHEKEKYSDKSKEKSEEAIHLEL